MNMNSRRYRKPDLMFLVALLVALGVLVTSVAHAAQPVAATSIMQQQNADPQSLTERWIHTVWGLDLANRLRSWKPKFETASCEDGFRLSQPFGERGPGLHISASVPERDLASLRAGGGSRIGMLDDGNADAYLFLHKRW